MTIKAISRLQSTAATDQEALGFIMKALKTSKLNRWVAKAKVSASKWSDGGKFIECWGKTKAGGLNFTLELQQIANGKSFVYISWLNDDGLTYSRDEHLNVFLPEDLKKRELKVFDTSIAKFLADDAKFMERRTDIIECLTAFRKFYAILVAEVN